MSVNWNFRDGKPVVVVELASVECPNQDMKAAIIHKRTKTISIRSGLQLLVLLFSTEECTMLTRLRQFLAPGQRWGGTFMYIQSCKSRFPSSSDMRNVSASIERDRMSNSDQVLNLWEDALKANGSSNSILHTLVCLALQKASGLPQRTPVSLLPRREQTGVSNIAQWTK